MNKMLFGVLSFDNDGGIENMAQPEKTFRQGCVSASVFANSISKNGRSIEIRNVVLQRNYRDKDGNWKGTKSFGINDLPKILVAGSSVRNFYTSIMGKFSLQ